MMLFQSTQNDVVDQACFSDIRGDGNDAWSLADLTDCIKSLSIDDRSVVDFDLRFLCKRLTHCSEKLAPIPDTRLNHGLYLLQSLKDCRRNFALLRSQVC